MALPELDLPVLTNWSCHSCGGCCKQHGVFITEPERERIEKQGWTPADGIPTGQPLFVKMGDKAGKPWHRLAHQPDGACVFLDERGLCRIHGKYGEPAKPLACRIYPYVFHPAGDHIVVSLRFSCPSVVANKGRSLEEQTKDLRELQRLVVPADALKTPAPALNAISQLDWKEAHTVVDLLHEILEDEDRPWPARLYQAAFLMKVLEPAETSKIRGQDFADLLSVVYQATQSEVPDDLLTVPAPSSLGWTQFRLLAGHYARNDTFASTEQGWRGRWKLLKAAWKFTRGKGHLPALRTELKAVPFAKLAGAWSVPEEADEIFARYYRVKLHGLHFCGPAYYRLPMTEGFLSLAMVYPVALWLARWLAASAGRDSLLADDVALALSIADHHHGYSPALGTWGFRRRIQNLSRTGDLLRLIAAFAGRKTVG